MPVPKIGAVVLAAGAGTRVGGPKALIEIGGRSLLDREGDRLREAGVATIAVVLGCEATEARKRWTHSEGKIIVHDAWSAGQTGSLLRGLHALPRDLDAFLIQPLDHAFVTTADLTRLVREAESEPALHQAILRLHYPPDHWGHPVLFGADYRAEFEALDGQPASSVARRHRPRVQPVIASSAMACRDVDTPADLEDLRRFLTTS